MFKKKHLSFLLVFVLTQAFAIEKAPLTEDESRIFIEMIADQSHSPDVRQNAFKMLLSRSSKTEPHYIPYCGSEEINLVKEVPPALYAEIVKSMTISCVDIFVYNFENNAYLMVYRTTPPAQGKWWMPGGRIFKGESFYESAVRKTKKESNLDICPIAQLGTYSTYFLESAWGLDVHTDTKNTVVLALCNHQTPLLDEHHQTFKWIPIDEVPEDPYILAAYKEAKAKLIDFGFIN